MFNAEYLHARALIAFRCMQMLPPFATPQFCRFAHAALPTWEAYFTGCSRRFASRAQNIFPVGPVHPAFSTLRGAPLAWRGLATLSARLLSSHCVRLHQRTRKAPLALRVQLCAAMLRLYTMRNIWPSLSPLGPTPSPRTCARVFVPACDIRKRSGVVYAICQDTAPLARRPGALLLRPHCLALVRAPDMRPWQFGLRASRPCPLL